MVSTGLQSFEMSLCRYSCTSSMSTCRSVQESVHYFKYKQGENVLYEYADDIAPRHLTATLPLDYDTVAAADKFGNLFVTRLPPDVSSQVSWPLFSVHGRNQMLSTDVLNVLCRPQAPYGITMFPDRLCRGCLARKRCFRTQ